METWGDVDLCTFLSFWSQLHTQLCCLISSCPCRAAPSNQIAVGRPRPDFLDRCLSIYDNDAAGTPVGPLTDPINMLSTSAICTRQDLLRDGFKSFPSGHSSFSFGGLAFLAMYLAGKLHLFDERGHIYKSLVVLAPIIGASLIATSRVSDYRHHWEDVTVGSFIGAVAAVFSYRQYYPSLAAFKSDSPFKPRVNDDVLPSLPTHVGERYRDDDDDEGVARGSTDATARGEGRGLVEQFFRQDDTEDSRTLDHHRQRQRPKGNNTNGHFYEAGTNGYLYGAGTNGQSSHDTPGSDARLVPI